MGLELEEYEEFSETGFRDPKEAPIHEIQQDLAKIVAVEGPATEGRILDLYREAAGYGRLKGPTRGKVLYALRDAAKRSLLVRAPDGEGSGVSVYRLPEQPAVRPRRRGTRTLEDIPLAEIEQVMRGILRKLPWLEGEILFRQVLDVYELRRLTKPAEERLQRAWKLASSAADPATADPEPRNGHDRPQGNGARGAGGVEASKGQSREASRPMSPADDNEKPGTLLDGKGQVVRVRALSSDGKVLIKAGAVIGVRRLERRQEWTVRSGETGKVRVFHAPPWIIQRIEEDA
jgi:hypothetical protein